MSARKALYLCYILSHSKVDLPVLMFLFLLFGICVLKFTDTKIDLEQVLPFSELWA